MTKYITKITKMTEYIRNTLVFLLFVVIVVHLFVKLHVNLIVYLFIYTFQFFSYFVL